MVRFLYRYCYEYYYYGDVGVCLYDVKREEL
jgi:hypothetical protein